LGYDDSLDVFGIHGVAGIFGAICLTFFIRPSWMEEAARLAGGSWTVWQQLGIQTFAVLVTILYTAIVSWILVVFVEKALSFRMSKAQEMAGLDQSLHGEHGYGLLNLN
jgi:Amt family ammonium transporter